MNGILRVGVLASGSGSNLQALLDRFNLGEDPSAVVKLVVGSRPGIRALDRARAAGVRAEVLPAARASGAERAAEDEAVLLRLFSEEAVQLVVLAGYLRLIPGPVVREYWGRMINIHPALLPSFGGQGMYGRRVHEAVLARGCRLTGVTIHFVSEKYDRGPILAQWPVPVLEGDVPESLAARVLQVEHRLLPIVVGAIARGWMALSPDGSVRWSRALPVQEAFARGASGLSLLESALAGAPAAPSARSPAARPDGSSGNGQSNREGRDS